MTWHATADTLHAYLAGRVSEPDAWSIEAHLISCERCRTALSHAYRTSRPDGPGSAHRVAVLDEGWSALVERLPRQGRIRPGTRWQEARVLVAGGPSARWAWLAACALVLVFAGALGATGVTQAPWLGVVAPLVPLLGVAASYGSGLDDAYEVIASTPGGGLRLLLVRSAVVLAATTPIAVVAGVAAGYGSPVPWMLASLALTLLTLAVGSVIGVERAAVAVGLGWAVAVGAALVDPAGPPPVLLTADAVPALLSASVLAAAVVAVRRASYHEVVLHRRTRIEVSP